MAEIILVSDVNGARGFSRSPGTAKKCMGIFQYYNRMKNIGYRHDQIKNLYYDDYDFVHYAVQQRKLYKQAYLNNIL